MAEETYAVLKTNHGDITVHLFANHAPQTVRNFVELAEGSKEYTDPRTGKPGSGPYYDGTIFHRIISGFMIQAGDPLGEGFGGPGFNFDDEIHPDLQFNTKYQLAMANAGKRGGKGTNGSQFFITVTAPAWLNGKHTIFGAVEDQASQQVVDKIAEVRVGPNDKPLEPVVLEQVVIERRAA